MIAALALAIPASSNVRLKIDTVPLEYAPSNSPTSREPVSLSSFHFEVDQSTSRARVVAIYTYPDEMTYERNDAAGGPRPTVVQIPGLTFDATARVIVYNSSGKKVVCATVEDHAGLFGHHLRVKNTGSCIVTASDSDHLEDDGWTLHRFRALDTYFEVH